MTKSILNKFLAAMLLTSSIVLAQDEQDVDAIEKARQAKEAAEKAAAEASAATEAAIEAAAQKAAKEARRDLSWQEGSNQYATARRSWQESFCCKHRVQGKELALQLA